MFLWLSNTFRSEFGALNVFRYVTFRSIGAAVTALVIALVLYPRFIKLLQVKQIGQVVRDDGPEAHLSKRGTPTMGGWLFIIPVLVITGTLNLVSILTEVNVLGRSILLPLVVMLAFAGMIGDFVHQHPTLKMLALSFLILIGVTLVGEALGQHIPKGYIYFSMAFACLVEFLNLRLRARSHPVELHQPYR